MKVEGITSIAVFADLTADELERVAAVSRPLQFRAGHVIVNEGEFAFDFYAIKQGAVEVVRSGERIATLGQGDVFGELGVVATEGRRWTRRRGASIVVTAPTEVIAIDGSEFRRLTEDIVALRSAVAATAAKRTLPT